jgi:hypothetical protein
MKDAVTEMGTLTPTSLRRMASALGRCSAELAGLGPPTSQVTSLYQIARRACASFEHGARCAAAAGRFPSIADDLTDPKLNKLLNCSFAGFNSGSEVIANAVYEGSSIP